MHFNFTKEQEKLRREVIEFCESPEIKSAVQSIEDQGGELFNAFSPEIYKAMGKKGWLGLQWPKEYGGQGATHVEMAVFNEVVGYYHIPMAGYGNTVTIFGNTVIHFGSEKLKKEFLPQITRGDIIVSQGFSEPNAGSDLASLQTRVVADGDEFVINGQKIFTTIGHLSQYNFLLARTDPNVPRHKGMSMFVVPMNSKGITIRPLWTLGDGRVNETFFEDVRIPKDYLIGQWNNGWYQATTTLDYERSGTMIIGVARREYEDLLQYCKETIYKGQPLYNQPIIKQKLAQLEIELETGRLLSYRVASMQGKGIVPNKEASMGKLFGANLARHMADIGMEILGHYGLVKSESKFAKIRGRFERAYRQCVMNGIAGGTNEVQKLIIAGRGLGMPR
ncbi:MAG: acyl-CoA dehydrogenase family protein [Candidatus Tectomicrobia bacterium]|uniref:Acyl-CoA dehydrogenase family protein n=1 Tax=Tectimicrobiota bacterium TaxID=2528274 RepID=A0A933LRS6_UNCTE|nr:acyl-CoA dehydrogenase family protein [Candidatus Tectomicrobia bacterium]